MRPVCGDTNKAVPYLTVILGDQSRRVAFKSSPGVSVRDILDGTDLRVRSGCRGTGLCGLCRVRIESGSVHPPTGNERLMVPPEQLNQSIRLACQVMPASDVSIRIVDAAPASPWRSLGPGAGGPVPADFQRTAGEAYGVAVDLGTTHISVALWDLRQGVRVAGRVGRNPQSAHGADVMTRLIAAGESAEQSRKLAQAAMDAIGEGLTDICSRHGINARRIVRVCIVGNTPMLAILTDSDPAAMLDPASWTQPMVCRVVDPDLWTTAWGLDPAARVEVVDPLAGFVGSDLLAGVLATRLTQCAGGLLLDFGTNSEVALWDGKTLWATSAAGGPAFEGSGIPGGMPAEPGAIDRVTPRPGGSTFDYHVIDDLLPRGICGSGLVDWIAGLLRAGGLSPKGKLVLPPGADGVVLGPECPAIRLDAQGIDLFQRAKAAIGVGVDALLTRAGMSVGDLQRVCVCGAFGQFLDVGNAQAIGLLPMTPPERVEFCGNTALGGCESLLLSLGASAELADLRCAATLVNLAEAPDFDVRFLECLYLRPLGASER